MKTSVVVGILCVIVSCTTTTKINKRVRSTNNKRTITLVELLRKLNPFDQSSNTSKKNVTVQTKSNENSVDAYTTFQDLNLPSVAESRVHMKIYDTLFYSKFRMSKKISSMGDSVFQYKKLIDNKLLETLKEEIEKEYYSFDKKERKLPEISKEYKSLNMILETLSKTHYNGSNSLEMSQRKSLPSLDIDSMYIVLHYLTNLKKIGNKPSLDLINQFIHFQRERERYEYDGRQQSYFDIIQLEIDLEYSLLEFASEHNQDEYNVIDFDTLNFHRYIQDANRFIAKEDSINYTFKSKVQSLINKRKIDVFEKRFVISKEEKHKLLSQIHQEYSSIPHTIKRSRPFITEEYKKMREEVELLSKVHYERDDNSNWRALTQEARQSIIVNNMNPDDMINIMITGFDKHCTYYSASMLRFVELLLEYDRIEHQFDHNRKRPEFYQEMAAQISFLWQWKYWKDDHSDTPLQSFGCEDFIKDLQSKK